MKEAIVAKDLKVSIINTPIPTPDPGQVVTKVIYSAACHETYTPGGSYAEYAVSCAHTTFRLPATDERRIPLVVYGASSAVGAYAVQFTRRSNVHPLICIAGRAQSYVETLIDRSKGDTIVDYRGGDEAVVQGIKKALKGEKCSHAYDAVSEKASFQNLGKVLESPSGKITLVLSFDTYGEIPEGIEKTRTSAGDVFGRLKDFGYVHCRYMSKGLEEGWFKGQPQEVVPGGLNGIEKALKDLKDGKASAVKYVFKISDTQGVAP